MHRRSGTAEAVAHACTYLATPTLGTECNEEEHCQKRRYYASQPAGQQRCAQRRYDTGRF